MDFSINDQELQDKTKPESNDDLIFKGDNGQTYKIVLYDGKPTDEPVPSE